jgi:fibronectin-binding autotransporter adhesin
MKTSQPARRPAVTLVTHTLALVLALVAGSQTVRAQTPSTWTNTSAATASWQSGTNWINGVPSGVGTSASVIADITAPQTITLDGAVTLGSLTIGDPTASGASAYTLNSGTYASGTSTLSGTLTFDVSSGSASLNQTATSAANVIAANIVLADPLTITNNAASAALTLAGSVSGAAGLTKAGAGVLTLTGASTFTGGVNLSSGSIRVGNNAALGAGTATIGNSTTLTANSSASRTLPNALSLSGSFTLGDATNSGVLNFTGAATLTGATQITNPTYVSLTGAIGEAGGARSLTKTGAGTLLLGASNSFTGGTTISNGSLELGASERLADAGNVTLTSGTFDLAGFTETINQFSVTAAASVTAGTLNATGGYSFSNASSTVTVAAALGGGAAALTKSGAGTVVLTGASSFGGGATITGGAVQVGNNSALGSGAVSVTAATLQSDSATARTLANPLTVGGSVTLGASNTGALTFSSTTPVGLSDNTTLTTSVAVTFSGGLSGTAGRSLTKAGSGVLTLAGPSSVAGGITINAGGVTVGTGGSLGGNVTVNGGGTLTNAVAGGVTGNVSLSNNATFTVTNSTTMGTVSVTGTGGTIGGTGGLSAASIDANVTAGGTATFSATLAGSGSFTKSGAGTAVMSGANTGYTGRVTLADGLMQYTTNNVTGSGTLSLVSGTLAANSTTGRTLGNSLVSFDGDVTIGGTANTGVTTFSGSGALTGDRTLTLLSDAVLTGGIAGPFGFTKTGTSTLTINGANTFTGTTRVVSGTLVLAAASPGKTGVTNVDGGALRLGNDAALGGASGDTLVLTSGAVTSHSGNRSIANPVTLAGNATVGGAGGTMLFTGSVTLTGNRTLSIVTSTTISGPIDDGGNGYRLTKSGNSALTLSGTNSYSGGTTISSGQLTFTSTAALGSGSVAINGGTLVASGPYLPVSNWLNSGRIAPDPNGGIAIIASSTEAINFSAYPNLSLAASVNATYSGTAFTPYTDGTGTRLFRLGGGAGVLTFSSTIANSGTIPTQVWIRGDTSGGAVVLGGSNSYTGGLYLDSGNLQVSNDNQLANITGSGSNAIVFTGGALRYSGTATDYSSKFAMPTVGNQIRIDTNNTQNVSFATVLTGSGGLAKIGGSGTLAATAAYAGPTNVSAGVLALTLSSTATPPTGGMTATGGTLSVLTTNDRTLASTISLTSGGAVQLSPAAGTTLTLSGTINRFILTGTPGPLTVTSGRVLFTGTAASVPDTDWTVSGGVLELANPSPDQNDSVNVLTGGTVRLGASDQILATGTINGTFDLNGFSETLATIAGSGTVTNSATAASVLTGTAASTITARLTDSQAGAGTLGLVISPTSSSTVISLSNTANDYRGGTTVQAGVLALGADNVLGSGGLTMLAGTLRSDSATGRAYSGTLTVGGSVTLGSTTVGQAGPLALSGPVVLSGGTRSITVNSDVTITGTISDGGNGNGLTKAGPGLLILAGTNTYSGLTSITSGTVRATGSNSTAGGTTLATSVLQLGRDNPLASGTLTLTSGTLSSDSATARTLTNPLLFGGNVTLGDATNTGALTLAGSGSGTAMRTLTVPGAVQLTGSLTGALGITKSGTGVLTITSTANNYTGGTTLNAGRIRAGSNSALGGAAGTVTLFSGALSSDGTTPRSLANNFSVTGNVTLGDATDSGALTLTGNTILTGNRTITFASDVTLTGVLGEQGPGRVLTKDGNGTFTLASPVSYTGGTVLNAGRIRVGVASALGTATTTLNGGSLSSDGSTPRTIGNPVSYGGDVTLGNASDAGVLTFSGTQTLTGNRTITVASDVVMSSRITDGGNGYGFTKTGTATLTLTGTSTFTGALSVNEGTVFVAAGGVVAPAGRVDVNAGAVLAGSGTVGALTVNNAGTLTPGTGPALISAASGVLQPTGNYNWQILNATGTAGQANGWDVLAITGTGALDLSPLSAASSATRFNLNTWTLSGTNPDVDGPAQNFTLTGTSYYRFQFATFADASRLLLPAGMGSAFPDQDLTTLFNLNTSAVNGTGGWDASQRPALGVMSVRVGLDGKSLDLVVVPEPSAICLAALGAVAMGLWRRRGFRRG